MAVSKANISPCGKPQVTVASQWGKPLRTKGSGDRYLTHLYTNKKWHVQQERIQIAESITPTAHLMNSSPTRSINIFKIETNQGSVT